MGAVATWIVAWASAYCASGSPMWSSAWAAATATWSARGSALPDVLGRGDDQAPDDEPRVLAGGDHRGQPVQRGVGVVAAEALDERRHRVVVAVAGAVVGEDALLGGGLDVREGGGDAAVGVAGVLVLGERDGALEHVQRLPRVAAGEVDEVVEGVRRRAPRRRSGPASPPGRAPRPSSARRTIDATSSSVSGSRRQTRSPRQEGGVDLEVRVLGRRADERDRAVLDVRQQRVLLGLVEAVDLVDEQDGAAGLEREPVLGLGDRRPGPRRRRT